LHWLHDHWALVRLGDVAEDAQAEPFDAEPVVQRPPPAVQRPFVLRGFRVGGNACEIVSFLPGVHPIGARWWEDLSAWFMVRGVARARPVFGLQPPVVAILPDASTDLH